MKPTIVPALPLLLVLSVAPLSGCSRDTLKGALYETLHNISDMKNEEVPEYDARPHEGYDVYKQRREEYLKEAD